MKKFMLGICAVLLAIGFSAFTNDNSAAKPKAFTQKYFMYDAYPSNDPVDLADPSNYSPTGNDGQDELDCTGSGKRCGVLATDNAGEPILSGATIFVRN